MASTYDLGDVVALAVEVRDTAGALANATAVALTVTLPDGTTTSPAVANPSTGKYTASYTPAVAGRFTVRWVATGTNACAFTDTFTVLDPTELGLLGLDDLKRHLNITGTSSDEELRATLLAATTAAEDYLHRPLRRRTRTQTFYAPVGNARALVLNTTDVTAVASVVEDGETLAADDYTADLNAGLLWRERGSARYGTGVWRFGSGVWTFPVTVTYTVAGIDSAALRQAVLELARHLWETQRGSMPMMPRGVDGMDAYNPAMGYSLPRRVTELLAPYRNPA